MKAHKVSAKHLDFARAYKRRSGFWNAMQTHVETACGFDDPAHITSNWALTDCKKCLAKRHKKKKKRTK